MKYHPHEFLVELNRMACFLKHTKSLIRLLDAKCWNRIKNTHQNEIENKLRNMLFGANTKKELKTL